MVGESVVRWATGRESERRQPPPSPPSLTPPPLPLSAAPRDDEDETVAPITDDDRAFIDDEGVAAEDQIDFGDDEDVRGAKGGMRAVGVGLFPLRRGAARAAAFGRAREGRFQGAWWLMHA